VYSAGSIDGQITILNSQIIIIQQIAPASHTYEKPSLIDVALDHIFPLRYSSSPAQQEVSNALLDDLTRLMGP
jgi:hypothetical protein